MDLAPGGGEESARAWRGASRFKFIATHSSLRPPHLLLGRVRRDWQRPQTAIKGRATGIRALLGHDTMCVRTGTRHANCGPPHFCPPAPTARASQP